MDIAQQRFDNLFEAYEARLRGYCARRVDRDVVDDVLNDTFAVAWRKIGISPEAARQRASRARKRLGVEFRRLADSPSGWARPDGQIREGAPS